MRFYVVLTIFIALSCLAAAQAGHMLAIAQVHGSTASVVIFAFFEGALMAILPLLFIIILPWSKN